MKKSINEKGFSLLEVMLVLVILVALGTLAISTTRSKMINVRLERTAAQMQQITQAAVSYYIDNHNWPASIGALAKENYLQQAMLNDNDDFISSWGTRYQTKVDGTQFLVEIDTGNTAYASVLKGLLPMAYVSDNTVISSVNIPSYNYNNAQSVSNMGIYDLGACVPEPPCPLGMKAQITTSVSGFAGITTASMNNVNATTIPIQSVMAYALGKSTSDTRPTAKPMACPNENAAVLEVCAHGATENYWRACLVGAANNGEIVDFTTKTGSQSTKHSIQILAMTNCIPSDTEVKGTQFNAKS